MAAQESVPTHAFVDVGPLFKYCMKSKPGIFEPTELTHTPVAAFYDLDLYDQHLTHCKNAFGPTFHHCIAIKSNSLSKMLVYANQKHGMGIECASIGETLHAKEHCKIPNTHIVFDSPCKTQLELEWAIREKIHTNIDNFDEFERAKAYVEKIGADKVGEIGFRINPLVGAGKIAALSVSTSESKFAVPVSEKEKLLSCYKENPWMNSVHVHVGSGGMGSLVLAAGIRVAVDFAKEINQIAGKQQITVIDIGGGLPVNYWGNEFSAENVPNWSEYADHLKQNIPELFSGDFKIVTEFGQSMNAKCGILASKVEHMKGTDELPIAVIHFGASECVRQAYTPDHKRRLEAYQPDGSAFPADAPTKATSVGGPLCFQGDFLAKKIDLPADLKAGCFMVMKDAGANTLSIFSRHCSRMCPAVYGIRYTDASKTEVKELVELKRRETREEISNFWGEL